MLLKNAVIAIINDPRRFALFNHSYSVISLAPFRRHGRNRPTVHSVTLYLKIKQNDSESKRPRMIVAPNGRYWRSMISVLHSQVAWRLDQGIVLENCDFCKGHLLLLPTSGEHNFLDMLKNIITTL